MSLKRFEGRSVDEALDHAAEQLGVERFRLSHHVVVEKRGFLGGTKRVVIEAWEDDIGNRIDAPPVESRPARPSGGSDRGRGGEKSNRGRGGRGSRNERSGGRRSRGDRDERRSEPAFDIEVGPAPPIAEDESEKSGELREWFEQLFALAGMQIDARAEEAEEKFVVRLYGDDAKKLLAKHGELLDSVQIIANKTVIVRSTQKTIELDAGEFREKRIENLESQAKKIADEVREDGQERALQSMSPVERRIVHIALRDDEDVETYSRGDGFYKRVVVTPRRDEGAADSAES